MQRWIGLGIIADNLMNIASHWRQGEDESTWNSQSTD
jgi:hypothetical protein